MAAIGSGTRTTLDRLHTGTHRHFLKRRKPCRRRGESTESGPGCVNLGRRRCQRPARCVCVCVRARARMCVCVCVCVCVLHASTDTGIVCVCVCTHIDSSASICAHARVFAGMCAQAWSGLMHGAHARQRSCARALARSATRTSVFAQNKNTGSSPLRSRAARHPALRTCWPHPGASLSLSLSLSLYIYIEMEQQNKPKKSFYNSNNNNKER